MSQNTNYWLQQIISIIKARIDRAGVYQRDPMVYEAFMSNLVNPSSDIHKNMMNYVNSQTHGHWVNGVNEHTFGDIMKPWIDEMLTIVTTKIHGARQQQQPYGYPQQQGYPQQGGYPPQNYGGYTPPPPPGYNTTAALYDGGPATQPPPAPVIDIAWKPDNTQRTPERETIVQNFDLGRPVNFILRPADTLQHHPKPGNVIDTDDYQEGIFEDTTRISTINIKLNTAENNVMSAVKKAMLYSPNEILRGMYANVVTYKEIFHIPIKSSEFRRIANLIGEQFYGPNPQQHRPDWRTAVKAMGSLNRAEHKVIETALLKILNPALYKFLRTAAGDFIQGIDEIDDLYELDNPKSRLKVTRHPKYLRVLDEVVTRAFDTLINPNNQINEGDKNFGDFVHCDKIEFWLEGRSKYDYGTFDSSADKSKFIAAMTNEHTVLRLEKNVVVTNAIDYQQAVNISWFKPQNAVLIDDVNNVGFKLLMMLDQTKSEVEGVVCVGDPTTGREPNKLIHMGATIDNRYVLIK